MLYTLTELEYEFAVLIGTTRQKEAEKKNRRADWTDGTELAHHIDGAAAEILAAKVLNIYYVPRINTFGTVADVGKNIEVRSTSANWYGVKVKEKDNDSRIVIGFRKVDDRTYNVLGWIKAKDAKKKKWLRDPANRNRPAYFIPESELKDIKDLPKDLK